MHDRLHDQLILNLLESPDFVVLRVMVFKQQFLPSWLVITLLPALTLLLYCPCDQYILLSYLVVT
jgi:hypothetical protein